jgi:hypothetical protein
MPKQRKWLILRGASLMAPSEHRRVERYVPPGPVNCPTTQQSRRLADRLETLLGDARQCADVEAAGQIQHILEGLRQRTRGRAGHDRRPLHAHP